jgi:hypothetical protein
MAMEMTRTVIVRDLAAVERSAVMRENFCASNATARGLEEPHALELDDGIERYGLDVPFAMAD